MKSLHSISYRAVSGLCKMLLVERQKVEGATPLKPKLQRLEMDNLMKIIIYRDKSSLRTLREPRRGPLRSSQDRFMKRAIIKAISSTRGLYKIFYLLFEIKKERSWIIFSHLRRLHVFRAGGRVRFGGVSFPVLESLDGTAEENIDFNQR